MSNWVECKDYGTGQAIYINLDMVVSVSTNGRSTVITYGSGEGAQIAVEGSRKTYLPAKWCIDAAAFGSAVILARPWMDAIELLSSECIDAPFLALSS